MRTEGWKYWICLLTGDGGCSEDGTNPELIFEWTALKFAEYYNHELGLDRGSWIMAVVGRGKKNWKRAHL